MMNRNEGTFVPAKEQRTKALEVLHIPEVRVSSASFASIRDGQGRYALLVNKNRAKKGGVVLTPIGGGIEATEEGLKDVQEMLGVEQASFEKGHDLRFRMPGAKANAFREWFLGRQNRESDPKREVVEELVDEAGLLQKEDVDDIECRLAGYNAELEATDRAGQEGQMTLRMLEVFDVMLRAEILAKLEERSSQPDAVIRFVTAEEISDGQTADGIKIGSVASSLLEPKDTIEAFV